MEATTYPNINKLLECLFSEIHEVLGNELLGLYLYGSATAGDFDQKISDIDLLAVIEKDLSEQEFSVLEKMHSNFVSQYPEWKDRIEVEYLSAEGLGEFKNKRSEIAVISPGEPLNIKDAGNDWLINWYAVQENGIALFGPNQASIIPIISKDEYVNANKEDVLFWRERIKKYSNQSTRGSCAYVIFTLCRAMYGYINGEQVSKKQAASWAARKFPQWASLIAEATSWRERQWDNEQKSIGSALSKVNEFVNFAIDQTLLGANT